MFNVSAISECIAFARRSGSNPVEIHVGPQTMKLLANHLFKSAEDNRSPLSRMFSPRIVEPRKILVDGLPLVENEDCAEGLVALRMTEQMNDPRWLRDALLKIEADKAAQTPREASESTPWMKVEGVVEPSQESGDAVSLDDLVKRPGALTPDAVLMKAFDGLENIAEVIVIRVHKGSGSIDMAASMPKLFAMGPLQAAIQKIMYSADD